MSNKSKRVVKTAVAVVLIGAIGGGSYYVYSQSKIRQDKQTVAAAVFKNVSKTSKVTKGDITSVITTTGSVELEKTYNISVTTNQDISKVLVNVGDEVKEGQTLIEYDFDSDKESLEKNLKDAELSLKTSELNLENFNIPATEKEIASLENSIRSAEKNLKQVQIEIEESAKKIEDAKEDIESAKKDVETYSKFYEMGSISKQEYEKYTETYEKAIQNLEDLEKNTWTHEYSLASAEYQLSTAKQNLEEALNPTMDTSTQIKYEQQLLSIESAKLKIEDIEAQIEDLKATSESPIDGVVITKNVEDGEVATASKTLLQIADLSQLIVNATVSEYEASDIAVGQRVIITSDGITDKEYEGKITFINPLAMSNGSETVVNIEVSIDNSDSRLRPGYTVDLEIRTADAENVVTVPIASVLKETTEEGSKSYVYVVTEEETIKKTYITTGVSSDMYIEVMEGLEEGEEILATPTSTLEDGQTLESVPSAPMAENSQASEMNGMMMPDMMGGGMGDAQNSGFMQGIPAGGAGGNGGQPGGFGGGR